ncbi:MAG: DUF4251 domain-containing protein [Winogradskyella sp.]|uniref:DUF4251 domain-containing protein n=1 Tax=Winogradskyella sp. TaxID=1883156 RepID=UPI00385C245D
MIRFCFFAVCTTFMLFSCKSADLNPSPEQELLLKNAIEKSNFRIESDVAYPQVSNAFQQVANSGLLQPGSTANAISLIGNTNFLEISGDSIKSFLPYFGERQMMVNLNDSGIEFNGLMTDYTVDKDKKGNHTITFFTRSHSEGFKVDITLYANAHTRMLVSGNGRFPISYAGRLVSQE